MRGIGLILGAVALAATALLAAPAAGASGEYTFAVQLAERCPEGTFPVRVTLPDGEFNGTVTLALDVRGRVAGTLAVGDSEIPLAGRYRANAVREKLSLKSPRGAPRIKLSGKLEGDAFAGAAKDRGQLGKGRGTFSIDVSSATPLALDVIAAFEPARPGIARATLCGDRLDVAASLKGDAVSKLKLRGSGFFWKSKGVVSEDAASFDSWKCRTYGVTAKGLQTAVGYDAGGPDLALVFVSGHPGILPASTAAPTLGEDGALGPWLESELVGAGYDATSYHFVDFQTDSSNGDGYTDLLDTLDAIQSDWIEGRLAPTEIVLVGYSHGGVRTHRALEDRPDLPVTYLVDLDANSCFFRATHLLDTSYDPIDRYDVVGSDFDVEDVVFDNVTHALEVVTDSLCPSNFQTFDDAQNVRLDGAGDGVSRFESDDSHTEIQDDDSDVAPAVRDWLLDLLGGST